MACPLHRGGRVSRRILHITTLLQGGAGRIVAELACLQRAVGQHPVVVCAAEGADDCVHYPAWLDRLAHASIPVIPVSCTFRRSLHHLLGAVTAIESAPDWPGSVDVVHAHAAVPALVGQLLAGRPPVLATMHGWNPHKSREHATTDVAIFNRLPVVTVPSRAAAGHLREAGVRADRLAVVPYGIAAGRADGLTPADASLLARWRAEGRIVAVCVGSVGARKRQTLLLEALAHPEVRHRFACAFIGEGPTIGSHAAQARAIGVADTAVFLGYRATVADWLQAADVAVFPSSREGLPIGMLEAAAMGRLLVASDIAEHRACVVSGVSGLLFAAGDSDSLARVLTQVWWMDVRDRRELAASAQATWARTHQPETMAAVYDGLYARLSGSARPPVFPDAVAS
jgi:L-malate glycosyltransferase